MWAREKSDCLEIARTRSLTPDSHASSHREPIPISLARTRSREIANQARFHEGGHERTAKSRGSVLIT